MRTRLQNLWERLRSSYWFLPGLMMIGAAGLSLVTQRIDSLVAGREGLETVVGWLFAGGPDGARTLLSTIAGSMITVAGVVFSLTMVALVLASSQFGPRLLGNFMRDTVIQAMLGTFTATFLYCLLALRLVRSGAGTEFVPYVSITFGFLFAVLSIVMLIYFIDHVAGSIQAPNVIARVGAELDGLIDKSFPAEPKDGESARSSDGRSDGDSGSERDVEEADRPACEVSSDRSGYVQSIDIPGLVSAAEKYGVLIEIIARPGDFVIRGSPLGSVRGGERSEAPDEGAEQGRGDVVRAVRRAFLIGSQRTQGQDPRFVLAQLVEIAVRALSPGINDPTTAVNCIDRLGAALAEVARRPVPSAEHRDGEGDIRLIIRPVTFAELLDEAFDPIREHGRRDTRVATRLLDTIGAIGRVATRESVRAALLQHADRVGASASEGVEEKPGVARVAERYETTASVLRSG